MDLEDLYLPCAIILFVAGFSLLILIAIPELYFALRLGFYHFVASLIMLGLSGVLALVYYFESWEPSEYEVLTFPSREVVRTEKIVNNFSTSKYRCKTRSNEPDSPNREELYKLKEALGIEAGSLQFKRRGVGIYHVVYNQGKHVWTHIGSWSELKEKLQH